MLESRYVTRTPHPSLRGVVHAYVGYLERSDAPLRRIQPAVTVVPLILSLGPPIAVDGVRHRSFVAGLYDRPALTEFRGEQLGIQVELSPLGARRLLSVPMRDLAGHSVPVGEVLGRAGDELVERLAGLPGWEARFALLDAVLVRRLHEAPPPRPAVVAAWSRLRETHGAITVEDLAREVGYSRRQLAVRFGEDVGLGPKAVARILRLERTCALLRSGVGLAEVAYAAGYADQPHLNREVRALTGVTPSEVLSLPNVQDARLSAA